MRIRDLESQSKRGPTTPTNPHSLTRLSSRPQLGRADSVKLELLRFRDRGLQVEIRDLVLEGGVSEAGGDEDDALGVALEGEGDGEVVFVVAGDIG